MIRSMSLLALCLGAATSLQAATGITYELRAIEAQSDPVLSIDGKPVSTRITVVIKPMGSLSMSTPACEADIDLGDGSPVRRELLGGSGKVRYDYEVRYPKPGDYAISVKGVENYRGCDGAKKSVVHVIQVTQEQASAAATEALKQKAYVLTATATNPAGEVRQPRMLNAECPKGWTLVPGSQYGPRFSCKIQPVEPLQCEPGTTYFESGTTIGCR